MYKPQFFFTFITENNVRRTNTGDKGLWETKNNAFGLGTKDGGRQYQLELNCNRENTECGLKLVWFWHEIIIKICCLF